MQRTVLILLALCCGHVLNAQVVVPVPIEPAPADAPKAYDLANVHEHPRFPGGEPAMYTYIAREVKYPEEAVDENIQGKVFVQFVVATDGTITDVSTKRGVHPALDREAVRVVKGMPIWEPGKIGGEPVPTRYVLPIFFQLD